MLASRAQYNGFANHIPLLLLGRVCFCVFIWENRVTLPIRLFMMVMMMMMMIVIDWCAHSWCTTAWVCVCVRVCWELAFHPLESLMCGELKLWVLWLIESGNSKHMLSKGCSHQKAWTLNIAALGGKKAHNEIHDHLC